MPKAIGDARSVATCGTWDDHERIVTARNVGGDARPPHHLLPFREPVPRRRREARVVHVDDERELTLRPQLPSSPANTAVEGDVDADVTRWAMRR
jgi:hypothetical protein